MPKFKFILHSCHKIQEKLAWLFEYSTVSVLDIKMDCWIVLVKYQISSIDLR